ncbi:substrate-binding periplasmic protein [Pseudomonas sp. NPDC077649]|uniref:substrate-binding periplasmic protein n=1 Tax=Pseudomonas sp. NPDC077649 TaxID=3364423 RepID=UPI0037C77FBA
MRRWASRLCLLLGLCASAPAAAKDLQICVSDRELPPLTFPDRDGQAQYLIRRAAAQIEWRVEFVALPWRRCLQAAISGELEGVATVAATAELRRSLALPLHHGGEDPARALGEIDTVVIKRRDSRVAWDGARFSGLHSPVQHEAGLSALGARLKQLGLPARDIAHSPEQLLHMLVQRRAEVALVLEPRAGELLARPEFQALQRLPEPFLQRHIYLGFNRVFYRRERKALQRIWQEIGHTRGSEEWRALGPRIYPGWRNPVPPRPGGGGHRP